MTETGGVRQILVILEKSVAEKITGRLTVELNMGGIVNARLEQKVYPVN